MEQNSVEQSSGEQSSVEQSSGNRITTLFVDFAKKLIFLLTYDKSGTIVFIKLFDD